MNSISCPVCKESITVSTATGRKSGKAFVMLKCSVDGRHFRAFITDKTFVDKVVSGAEEMSVTA